MCLYPLSIPLSAELKMPFLGMISPACWNRTYFIQSSQSWFHMERLVTPLIRHLSRSLTPSSEKSAAAKWMAPGPPRVLLQSIFHRSALYRFLLLPLPNKHQRCTTLHLSPFLFLWNIQLYCGQRKIQANTGFCSWICYLRQAERTLPLFQIPQGQKSFTVSCF